MLYCAYTQTKFHSVPPGKTARTARIASLTVCKLCSSEYITDPSDLSSFTHLKWYYESALRRIYGLTAFYKSIVCKHAMIVRPQQHIVDWMAFEEAIVRVMSRFGDLAWPLHSPDLSMWDFFLWCHLKANVYKEKPCTLEELKIAIRNQTALINELLLCRVEEKFLERIEMCVLENNCHLGDEFC